MRTHDHDDDGAGAVLEVAQAIQRQPRRTMANVEAALVRPRVALGVLLRIRNVHLADEQLVQALRTANEFRSKRNVQAPGKQRAMPKTSEAQPVKNSSSDSMALMPMSLLLPASSACGRVPRGGQLQRSDRAGPAQNSRHAPARPCARW